MVISPFLWGLLAAWFALNGLFFLFILDSPMIQNDLSLLPSFLFGSGLLVWLLLPSFPPLLTLRLFAEEHRLGTLEPLLTAPIRDIQVILAKYVAVCLFFLVFWGGVFALFLFLASAGAPMPWGAIAGGLLGALLTSFLFLATGMFASAWGGNLVLAAGGGAAMNYALLFLPELLQGSPGLAGEIARSIHLTQFLDTTFSAGVLDTYPLVYLLATTVFFLYLTWVRLASRRWLP
ncbi:MAG: ABC transporter permease subunit [Planctomycetes bacterium]|nr:ABC transporter permease subunit [Planctomycetota bacterium]MBT4029690.1 ABC transporter permease subunit [Planctomycetota bacterium]MBT4561190.1 ABC transporter permease subunit [Planctomycetota bacterium]MBT5119238.1 ABC transporter permease subunit [Planctomycetota bacterium]MBT7012930.1 ABC transporter permease subunit [Planctomycetota bacterium]